MPIEFINPNWHVILIHYPIGLLTIGLIIEIISCFKPKGGLRAAGRWMIALGAVLALPTLTSGLYAFRDTVSNDAISMGENWHDLAANSPWNEQQWKFMERHIWLNSVATGLGLVIVLLWLANPDRRRRKLYWILLPLLVIVNGLVAAGAWHSGEAVFRYGTAVAATNPNPPTEDVERDKDYYAHPLQVHVVLAGLAVAASLVGMALMFRKWEKPAVVDDRPTDDLLSASAAEPRARSPVDPIAEDPARDRYSSRTASLGPYGEEDVAIAGPPRVYPGWFYFTGSVIAVATAFFGAWSTVGEWTDPPNSGVGDSISRLTETVLVEHHRRLLWHSIFGISIVLLPLVVGLLVRLMRRGRIAPLILTALLLVAIGLQIWLGILILYDGHEGPVFRFDAAAGPDASHGSHPHAAPGADVKVDAETRSSSATTRAATQPAPATLPSPARSPARSPAHSPAPATRDTTTRK